jgi:hypothetical protein
MQGVARIRNVIVGAVAVAAAVVATPASGSTLSCDGPARAGAGGAPELLTNCGRIDPSLGANAAAGRAVDRLAPSLGVRPSSLGVTDADRIPGGRIVRLQQSVHGIPVLYGEVVLGFSEGGAMRWVRSSAISEPPQSLNALIDRGRALGIANASIGDGTALRDAPTIRRVIYPSGAASVLAWHVVLPTATPPADWNLIVDARTGAVVDSWNAIADANSASIYDPSPVQTAGTFAGFNDANDANSTALTNARLTGFPLTRLNPSVDTLKGDFADLTATGIDQTGTLPYVPGAAHSATRDYNYMRADNRFEEASVYAAITGAQTKIQQLGFTDANNRSIPVDVHYDSVDNSFYSSDDHALHFGDGGVDDAEDADIVLHEYGHSIQDNQVPGFGPGVFDTEQGAIGEGFGDFFAGMYYLEHGNATYQANRRYCIGEWDATSYNDFTGANNGSGCLRWIDGTNEFDGTDIGQYPGTPTEVHDDGRFWSAAMTCIFEGLGGNVAARDQTLKLVLAQNAMLVPDESDNAFEDSVAALRVADQNMFGGADVDLINNCAFQRRLIATLPSGDATPPQVQAVVDPAQPDGDHGFYRHDVQVSWQVTEPEGSVTTSGCGPTTISADTPGTTLTCTATSPGGVGSQSVTIKRDATKPDTDIKSGPKKKTKKAKAKFKFKSDEQGAKFECSLDGAKFKSCDSPEKFKVDPGKHKLAVRAIDKAGNQDGSPAKYSWKRKPKR